MDIAALSISLTFPGKADFHLHLDDTMLPSEVPEWATFSHVYCPGNQLHKSGINFCRLACQLQHIISYFDTIRSIDQGQLLIREGKNREQRIKADAQGIFFHIICLLLSSTSCPVFTKYEHFRQHYKLSTNPRNMFYTYLSIFLVNSFFENPQHPVALDRLKDVFKMETGVLHSLIKRLNLAAREQGGDASRNGLIIFETLLRLMELNFNKYLAELKELIPPADRHDGQEGFSGPEG